MVELDDENKRVESNVAELGYSGSNFELTKKRKGIIEWIVRNLKIGHSKDFQHFEGQFNLFDQLEQARLDHEQHYDLDGVTKGPDKGILCGHD